jgi:plasmid stability protein
MNLTIKNLPGNVHKTLKREATRHGRSLNAEAIQALTKTAEEAARRQKMQTSFAALDRFVDSLPKMPSSVSLIRAERNRR